MRKGLTFALWLGLLAVQVSLGDPLRLDLSMHSVSEAEISALPGFGLPEMDAILGIQWDLQRAKNSNGDWKAAFEVPVYEIYGRARDYVVSSIKVSVHPDWSLAQTRFTYLYHLLQRVDGLAKKFHQETWKARPFVLSDGTYILQGSDPQFVIFIRRSDGAIFRTKNFSQVFQAESGIDWGSPLMKEFPDPACIARLAAAGASVGNRINIPLQVLGASPKVAVKIAHRSSGR